MVVPGLLVTWIEMISLRLALTVQLQIAFDYYDALWQLLLATLTGKLQDCLLAPAGVLRCAMSPMHSIPEALSCSTLPWANGS